jgi:hypothetical protein
MFEKGQKVTHTKVKGEMTVVGPAPLGAVATKFGVKSHVLDGRTQCDFTQKGKPCRRSFRNNDLTLVD